MAAGYSGTPLINKLGIKPSTKLRLINHPPEYFTWLGVDLSDQLVTANASPDLVHVFVKSAAEMIASLKKLSPKISNNPQIIIWVSWYKKSAGIETDVTEDVIRNWALKNGLVDVKVCAVSDKWSGLKLVVPLAKRKN